MTFVRIWLWKSTSGLLGLNPLLSGGDSADGPLSLADGPPSVGDPSGGGAGIGWKLDVRLLLLDRAAEFADEGEQSGDPFAEVDHFSFR